MTIAICLNCGARKMGALTKCGDCQYVPVSQEDQAKAMIVSDWFQSPEALAQASESIAAGHGLTFRPQDVDRMLQYMKSSGMQGLADDLQQAAAKKEP